MGLRNGVRSALAQYYAARIWWERMTTQSKEALCGE
jgi:hypothetical protein